MCRQAEHTGEEVVCLLEAVSWWSSSWVIGSNRLILGFSLLWSSSLWSWIPDLKHFYDTNLCGFFFSPFFQGQVLPGQKSPWRLWYQSGTGNHPEAQSYICIIIILSWHPTVNHLVLQSRVQCLSLDSRLSISFPHPSPWGFSAYEIWLWRLHFNFLTFFHGAGVCKEAGSVTLRDFLQYTVLRLRKTLGECLPGTPAIPPYCWLHDFPGLAHIWHSVVQPPVVPILGVRLHCRENFKRTPCL